MKTLKTQTKLWQYKLTVPLEKARRRIIYTKVFEIQNTREISSNTVSETRVSFLGCYGMIFFFNQESTYISWDCKSLLLILFYYFEIGSHCAPLAGLQLAVENMLDLCSQRSAWLCLIKTRNKGMCYHA